MPTQREQFQQAIAAQESLRPTLGDATVDAVITAIERQLAELESDELPSAEQRKLVTVLFADVFGFTAMTQNLDAEDVKAMMDALWRRLASAIVDEGGLVDKYIGDAVMALWGSTETREDDAVRAIRAGLAIQSVLADFQGVNGVQLRMRIGINTGLVVLGPAGDQGEFTAMGDTVNIASRLEQAAPVGGVLISHDTFRQVRGLFDVAEELPIKVKGKDELLKVYTIQRARPRAFRLFTRGVEGVETRMIGRDAEFKHLQETFQLALDDQAGQVATVSGDAGLGKSRLLYELGNWIDLRPEVIWVFRARTTQQTVVTPYGLFRDLFSYHFDIQDNDPAAVAREKLVKGVAEFLKTNAEERAHLIGQLIGLDFSESPFVKGILSDSKQIHDRAFHYISEFFKAACASGPVALYFEDIHWAGEGSLDLIAHIAQETRQWPVFILCTTRPTLIEDRPLWGSGQANYSRIDLQPLSKPDSRLLADEILQKMPEVPTALSEMVIGIAEGNPFYMEELIKMLIDDGVIVAGEGDWHVEPGKLIEAHVPPTLTGVLQARLDSLPAQEKLTLQRASVVGQVFWDALVASIGAEGDRRSGHTDEALVGLAQRQLVYGHEGSAFAGVREFSFKHAILHQITYETVLKRERKIYHKQVAEWLASSSEERTDEYASLIADHYERAGEAAQAAAYLKRAAEHAERASAFQEAIIASQRALALLGDEGPEAERARLALLAGQAKFALSDFPAAEEALHEALDLTRIAGDERLQAEAVTALGRVAAYRGDYAAAEAGLDQAVALARASGDLKATAAALDALGQLAWVQGQPETIVQQAEEALLLYQALGDLPGQARSHIALGNALYLQGELVGYKGHFEECLRLSRASGDWHEEAIALLNLGDAMRLLGDTVTAYEYTNESLRISREIGAQDKIVSALFSLGLLARDAGDLSGARAHLREGLVEARQNGSLILMLWGLSDWMTLLTRAGNGERALEIAGLVLAHRSTNHQSRKEMAGDLVALESKLGQKAFNAGLQRGENLMLDNVVNEILKAGD
jgi:class 3 adenylate cyclase/predicted ATPase